MVSVFVKRKIEKVEEYIWSNRHVVLLITIDNMDSSLAILFGNNSGKTIEKSSKNVK